jgi:hypothetical protein
VISPYFAKRITDSDGKEELRKSELLSYLDHNPKKSSQEYLRDNANATSPQPQQRRLGRRIMELIGSSR